MNPEHKIIHPTAEVFSKRAQRLESLAEGHNLAEYLRWLALIAHAQNTALLSLDSAPVPLPNDYAQALSHGMPPINIQNTTLPPSWMSILQTLIAHIHQSPAFSSLPQATRQTLDEIENLLRANSPSLSRLAQQILQVQWAESPDKNQLLLIAGALQVLWTHWSMALSEQVLPNDTPHLCPTCGYFPDVAVIQTVAGIDNLRFLHCPLCNSQWHFVRARCTVCDNMKELGYYDLQSENGAALSGANPAVRGEACPSCQHYLKLIFIGKGGVDASADDIASLSLDILLDEAGYTRAGANLSLFG